MNRPSVEAGTAMKHRANAIHTWRYRVFIIFPPNHLRIMQ
jgi:hypothetical protein